MKTEKFGIDDKNDIFSKAYPMHDCSFTCSFQCNTLTLIFDNLEQYYDESPEAPWFGENKRLTINYRDVRCLDLSLRYGKKEKDYYETVEPLKECHLIMYKYSIDSFDAMTLEFYVTQGKKNLFGKIDMYPKEIEYIWES